VPEGQHLAIQPIARWSSWLVPCASRLGPADPGNPSLNPHNWGEPPQPRNGHAVLETFDWNCQQHIVPPITEQEIVEAIRPLRDRLAQLESENAELRARLANNGDS
jgi:hypothetical protein